MAVAASGQGGVWSESSRRSADALVAETPAERMEMRGRPMQGWLRVAEAHVATDEALADWVRRGLTYAGSLPAKP
jgi:hypothetical protein